MTISEFITTEIEYVKELICDEYCRYPREDHPEEYLTEICENCPLNRL